MLAKRVATFCTSSTCWCCSFAISSLICAFKYICQICVIIHSKQSIDCLNLPYSFLECVVDVRSKAVVAAANKKGNRKLIFLINVDSYSLPMRMLAVVLRMGTSLLYVLVMVDSP